MLNKFLEQYLFYWLLMFINIILTDIFEIYF